MDKSRHRYFMAQILSLIFKDNDICNALGFKGGTALMFFHDLPRFSTDLDFNLLDLSKKDLTFKKVRSILTHFGTIDDEAIKQYGLLFTLSYAKGERMVKIEISTREFDNHYEIKNLAGTDIRVMTLPDMFAHKLCALGERLSPRDIFDVWFFLQQKHASINENIIKERTGKSVSEYAKSCSEMLKGTSPKIIMQGLGEVLDNHKQKIFVKSKLLPETIQALELFAAFPQIVKS